MPATQRAYTSERILRLARGLQPMMRRAFEAYVNAVLDSQSIDRVEELLRTGRAAEALAEAERASRFVSSAYADAANQAARDATAWLNSQLVVTIAFDVTHDAAVRAMRSETLRLVRELSASQREAVREALTESIRRGMNPRQAAVEVRRSAGLTASQVQTTNNYRRLLEESSAEALNRQLRDRRFDARIQGAVDGNPLTADEIDRMTAGYARGQLRMRAETIARTEAMRAVSVGNHLGLQQAVLDGNIQSSEMVRTWSSARDSRTRDSHAAMDGQTVEGTDTPFTSGNGVMLRFPHDPNAPPEETINCRCAASVRVKDAAMARGL